MLNAGSKRSSCRGGISGVGRIWADGQELAADAVTMRVYSGAEDQLPDPKIEAVEGAEVAAEGEPAEIRGIVAPDDHTVEFRLRRPFMPLLGVLSVALMVVALVSRRTPAEAAPEQAGWLGHVDGLKPRSLRLSSISAQVAVTSPACMGS